MTRELVFHLGDRKTGSTSIQATLRAQDWKGGTSTIGYPARLHCGQLAKALAGRLHKGAAKRPIRKLRERLDAVSADIAVISSEDFEVVDPQRVAEMLAADFPEFRNKTRLIAYVRPHADRILSSYSERVKLGLLDETLETFVQNVIKNRRFFYAERFTKWRAVFGERFELRPMMRSRLHMNCVVRDFLSFALQSHDFELLNEPASNASLTVKDLAILIELHRNIGTDLSEKASVQSVGRNLGIILGEHALPNAPRLALSHPLSQMVIEAHRNDAAQLDAAFFADSPMSLALEDSASKAVDSVASIQPEDNFTPDELRMLRVWATMAGQMYRINPEGWTKHFSSLRLGSAGDDDDETPEDQAAKAPSSEEKRRAARLNAELRAIGKG
jgi:hypothetical protein